MALHMYLDAACTNAISENTGTNPDTATGDAQLGFTDEKPLYIKNDDATKKYVQVTLTANGDDANVDIKYAPDVSGSPGTYADTISIPDITDATTIVKIWRKIIVAGGQPSQTRTNIKHRLIYQEQTV